MAPYVDKVGRRAHVKTIFFVQVISLAIAMVTSTLGQEPTLARLSRDADGDIPRASIGNVYSVPQSTPSRKIAALHESVVARESAQALFVRSNLEQARALAVQALRHDPNDSEALFVRMEVAAMEDDEATMLNAAVRLCEAGAAAPVDPRVALAAARIRDAAANTPSFRAVIPQVKTLLANTDEPRPALHDALLRAAMDGAPGLDPYAVSRAAGILTDWRIVGAGARLGGDQGISRAGDLSSSMYRNRVVENFQFPDGQIVLPEYLAHRGAFYGAAHFASPKPGTWRVDIASSGEVEVYIDGRRIPVAIGARGHRAAAWEALPGPHRVLVAFAASDTPLRVAITPATSEVRPVLPSRESLQELTYQMAAGHYAGGDFDSAVQQIDAVPSAEHSVALEFLLAQSKTKAHGVPSEVAAAWQRVHATTSAALAADDALAQHALEEGNFALALRLSKNVVAVRPTDADALEMLTEVSQANYEQRLNQNDLWARRVEAHPSCSTLRAAASFYQQKGDRAQASLSQRELYGCAPESLDYARSLAGQGSHAKSAQALRTLLSAAPLNREASLMLVRELQLAGDDEAAQRAAADWLRVAPNAGNYHRLAATLDRSQSENHDGNSATPFYAPYRRDVSEILRDSVWQSGEPTDGLLLEDHVAIARADGSVSLYVHTVVQLWEWKKERPEVPQGAQLLAERIVHADGSRTEISEPGEDSFERESGDAIEEEYVINYAGDGGIPEHCEAFQFVFGGAGDRQPHARFVVLTPANQADRGVVIATGGSPAVTSTVREGMLQRVWDSEGSAIASPISTSSGSPIVRVVEEENGWATPSSAEHQRRIETIHPGPRPEES